MEKNKASKWLVFAFGGSNHSNPGDPVTGEASNITASINIDGSSSSLTDTNPIELSGGYYLFDVSAAENNGDFLALIPTCSTANVEVIGVPGSIYTTPKNFNILSITDSTGRVDLGRLVGTTQTAGNIINTLNEIKGTGFNTADNSLKAIVDNHPPNFKDLLVEPLTGSILVNEDSLSLIVEEIDFSSLVLADISNRLLNSTDLATFKSYLDGTEFMPVDPYKIDFSVTDNTLTVRKPDDITVAYTKTLTGDAGAIPVVGSS